MNVLHLVATGQQNTNPTFNPLMQDTPGVGARGSSPNNYVIEQGQEVDDLNKVTHKLASEIPGKNKRRCLSQKLQVAITEVSIHKMPAV